MKKFCSNCKHAVKVGEWLKAETTIPRRRIVECGATIPDFPAFVSVSFSWRGRYMQENYRERQEVQCKVWEPINK